MLVLVNYLLVTTSLETITLVEVHLGSICIENEAVVDTGTIPHKFPSWVAVEDLVSIPEATV